MKIFRKARALGYLAKMRSLHKTELHKQLLPCNQHHNLKFTDKALFIYEDDVHKLLESVMRNEVNKINFSEVKDITCTPEYLIIILRSGHFHALSKVSADRIYKHLFDEEGYRTSDNEIRWLSILGKILVAFDKKDKKRSYK